MKGILMLLTGALINTYMVAQTNDSRVVSFNAKQHDDYIHVTFTIAIGNQCSGVVLEHTSDSVNFMPVYNFPGICGSSDRNETYSYDHRNIRSNGKNYYRLGLGGATYTSAISAYYYNYGADNYIIYPMPVTKESKLYFRNNTGKKFSFDIINQEGKTITTTWINNDDPIDLGNLSILPGKYVFKLTAEDNYIITGKFIIP